MAKLWYDKNEEVIKTPLLVMLGIDDEEKINTYAKEVNNKLVRESVLKLKKLNQDVDFVYGISPEEDDIYMQNTEIYLAAKEAEERGIEIGKAEGIEIGKTEGIEIGEQRGEQRGKVIAYHELGLDIKEIMDKTRLTEQEINDIINS